MVLDWWVPYVALLIFMLSVPRFRYGKLQVSTNPAASLSAWSQKVGPVRSGPAWQGGEWTTKSSGAGAGRTSSNTCLVQRDASALTALLFRLCRAHHRRGVVKAGAQVDPSTGTARPATKGRALCIMVMMNRGAPSPPPARPVRPLLPSRLLQQIKQHNIHAVAIQGDSRCCHAFQVYVNVIGVLFQRMFVCLFQSWSH